MSQTKPHRILLITTGGTVAGNVAQRDPVGEHAAAPNRGADDFQRMIAPARQHLEEMLGQQIEVDGLALCDIDSSDIQPSIWVELAQLIYDKFDEYDSFLITHGTNTLGYTCAALSFAIVNSGKPIIFTGSQVPAGLPGADALTNLENALRIAVWDRPGSGGSMQGVVAVFGSRIITGTRVKKDTAFDYDALKSVGVASIGRIGRIIAIDEANLARHRSYLWSGRFPTAYRQSDLIVDNRFDANIVSLTEFPGMSEDIFATLVEHNDARGFILRSFGAGDPATRLRGAFAYLKNLEVPIVVTTQAPSGNSNFQVNEAGRWLRDHDMAIPAFDMSIEAQTAKLAWLLAKRRDGEITYRTLCQDMVTDMRGEGSVLWEVRS